jgi:hypothetical protein
VTRNETVRRKNINIIPELLAADGVSSLEEYEDTTLPRVSEEGVAADGAISKHGTDSRGTGSPGYVSVSILSS